MDEVEWRRRSSASAVQHSRWKDGEQANERVKERWEGAWAVKASEHGAVARMRTSARPRGSGFQRSVGHAQQCRFKMFEELTIPPRKYTETRIFFLPYLPIQLTCDHGARGKFVDLCEVNNIALKTQS
jgi:hypothetical protein